MKRSHNCVLRPLFLMKLFYKITNLKEQKKTFSLCRCFSLFLRTNCVKTRMRRGRERDCSYAAFKPTTVYKPPGVPDKYEIVTFST